MKVLIETSVLFPAVIAAHPKHVICRDLLTKLQKDHDILVLNTHLIAEMYSNLTRFPLMKVTPDHARKMMYQLAEQFEHVELSVADYLKAVDRCADRNLVSGVIFDALHFEAALKSGVDRLYTANTKDFSRFVDEDTPFQLIAPY